MGKWLAATLIILLILLLGIPLIQLQTTRYITAYEGAKAAFHGVLYNNLKYTNAEKHGASLCRFDTLLRFDPDEMDRHQCNLIGETTSVFIPRVEVAPSWVPWEWARPTLEWRNPVNTYEWQIADSAGNIHYYHMEEWATVWYLTISAEYDSGPDFWRLDDEAQNRRYRNTEVWFEFDLQPVWYFEGTQAAYFAIAKIELYNVKTTAKDMAGNIHQPRTDLSFAPESPGTLLTIYLTPFGEDLAPNDEQLRRFYYHGTGLNPQYFRDKVYTYIALEDFGTEDWVYAFGMGAKGDVITLMFKVTVFVVGEWVVRDIRDLPESYGRMAKTGKAGFDIGKAVADALAAAGQWLSNPLNQLWVLFIIIVIAIIVITVLNPGIWITLISALRRKG